MKKMRLFPKSIKLNSSSSRMLKNTGLTGMKILFVLTIFFISSLNIDAQVFTVINTNDTGAGSLRQAIVDANAYSGTNPQIVFDIPFPATSSEAGWDWWTITITSASLPAITKEGTQILGFTQSVNRGIIDNTLVGTGGFVGVDQFALPKFERPTICINAGDKTAPLKVSSTSVILEGLSIYNSTENTVYVTGNAANTIIRKMFVGVWPSGNRPTLDAERNNRMGIQISTNANNLVTVTNCYIGHNGRLGINGASSESQVLFEYNEVFESNWYGDNSHDGIDVNGINSTVRYNLVYDTRSGSNVPATASTSGGAGIECGSTTPTKVTNFLIENNTCHSNEGPGVNVINGCTYNTIKKNLIYNNKVGVSINTRSSSNTNPATGFITMNSIYDNITTGIDINHTRSSSTFDGITENSTVSVGTGPFGNDRQTYPEITSAYNQAGSFYIVGSLQSVANTTHRLEFFVNNAKDLINSVTSDFGEGETFLLAFDVITDNSGFVSFAQQEPTTVTNGYYLSATASNTSTMVTSEFSPVVEVTGGGAPLVIENYYPATGFGTLAFEDLWPAVGDYDFNDLIVDYQYVVTSDQSNIITQIKATFIIKAFGATYQNGFGFQMGPQFNSSHLNVTGSSLTESYLSLAANGLENGQAKPTIIVFDNAYNQMTHPGVGIGVNTDPAAPFVTPDTINLLITFIGGNYALSSFDLAEINPFLIVDKNRGKEVHLPDYPPTTLATQSIFGTYRDDSNPAIDRYYKTETNLPWAINIFERFAYPIEKAEISSGHLKFVDWIMSNGVQSADWYQNKPGYRSLLNIYSHP